jgi:predicted branched-subunit amino acid permease
MGMFWSSMMFKNDFYDGVKTGVGIAISIAPFGAIFGAVAVDTGLSIAEATLMSVFLYAGVSQLVGIDMFGKNIAAWMIILSILAVNFRHILYSAAMVHVVARWTLLQKAIGFFVLVDPQFATSVSKHQSGERVTFSWYMGYAAPLFASWILSTIFGAFFGNLVTDPRALGFDVLLPIYFMGMVMGFRSSSNFMVVMAVSAICSSLAFHFVGSPWHVSIGGIAGILVAVMLPPKPSALQKMTEGDAQ